MLKYFFAFIVLIQGCIHLMGFAKAFGYGNIAQLTKEISKPAGMLWLVTDFLFIAAIVLFLLKNQSWPPISIVAVMISQVLILNTWHEAKFGTIANLIMGISINLLFRSCILSF